MMKTVASINRNNIGSMQDLINVADELVQQYNLESKADIAVDVAGNVLELCINVPEPVYGTADGYKTSHFA